MSAEASKRWRERNPEKARRIRRNSDAKRRAADPLAAKKKSRLANEIYRKNQPENVKASQVRYRTAHPVKIRERSRKQKTGWSPDAFDEAWVEQNGRCAICLREMLNEGTTATSVNADHCHRTGRTRGLLCHKCNVILGHYEYARAHPEFEAYLAKFSSAGKHFEEPLIEDASAVA